MLSYYDANTKWTGSLTALMSLIGAIVLLVAALAVLCGASTSGRSSLQHQNPFLTEMGCTKSTLENGEEIVQDAYYLWQTRVTLTQYFLTQY